MATTIFLPSSTMREAGMGATSWVKGADHEEDAWAAKMWAVYIAEAEKYDKVLVDRWKSDMEGIVIFAALFSGILTAFVIESYRNLTPDSGEQTVLLLTHLSQQLAGASNSTSFYQPTPAPFRAPTMSLICNALWFISLGLSLACALIATLVQQWARDFLHRAQVHSTPLIRARIFAFLYYGLKNFCMHRVVELVPLLLHISLLLFFVGLVAFLIPVNLLITAIVFTFLLVIGGVYATITLLPLLHLDSPYRTPLSNSCWSAFQKAKDFWTTRISQDTGPLAAHGKFSPTHSTLVKAMSRAATQEADERSERDYDALAWTLKLSIDDVEFEPLVEAIPHLLWGPNGRRITYENNIKRLALNPDIGLYDRILALLNSCDSGTLSSEARKHRRLVSLQALWALGSVSLPTRTPSHSNHAIRSIPSIAIYPNDTEIPGLILFDAEIPEIAHCLPSAWAMIRWTVFCALRGRLIHLRDTLSTHEAEMRKGRHVDLGPLKSELTRVAKHYHKMPHDVPELSSVAVHDLRKLITRWLEGIPYRILFELLFQSATSDSPLYRKDETVAILGIDRSVPFPAFSDDLEALMSEAIYSHVPYRPISAAESVEVGDTCAFDESMAALLAFWTPSSTLPIPDSVIHLINHLGSDNRLSFILSAAGSIETHLWSNFPVSIPSQSDSFRRDAALSALWRLASLYPVADRRSSDETLQLSHFEAILHSISTTEFNAIQNSIVALVKNQMLETHDLRGHFAVSLAGLTSVKETHLEEAFSSAFNLTIFPTSTAIRIPEYCSQVELVELDWDFYETHLNCRKIEARFVLIAEFLEYCHYEAGYKPVETLSKLNQLTYAPTSEIHSSHQIRLAKIVYAIFSAWRSVELMDAVLQLFFWQVYVDEADKDALTFRSSEKDQKSPALEPWLVDHGARSYIRRAMIDYSETLTSTNSWDNPIVKRIRQILRGLDSLHSLSTEAPPYRSRRGLPDPGMEHRAQTPLPMIPAEKIDTSR